MNQTPLPENGAVVIIEDKIEEARPLIEVLSRRGVAATYYDGSRAAFPARPMQRIRIIFLDLQTVRSSDEHTLSTMHVSNIRRLLPEDNGPYIVIIWSGKGHAYARAFVDEISKPEHNIRPAFILELDKADYFKTKGRAQQQDFAEDIANALTGRFEPSDLLAITAAAKDTFEKFTDAELVPKRGALRAIERQLKIKLKDAGVFHLFILWENVVNRAAGQTVRDVASLCQYDQHWEGNLRDVLRRMSAAQGGKNIHKLGAEELLCLSLKTLNSSYVDRIETALIGADFSEHIDIRKPKLLFSKSIGNEVYSILEEGGKFHIAIDGAKSANGKKELADLAKLYNDLTKQTAIKAIVREYDSIASVINRTLLLDLSPARIVQPGNVYEVKIPTRIKRKYLATYFKRDFLAQHAAGGYAYDATKIRFLELEVSPPCDYSQNKWCKSRLVSGILFPAEYRDRLEQPGYHSYVAEPNIEIKGKLYGMCFNCRFLKSKSKHANAHSLDSLLFRVKNEMLVDVLAKIANHINRPGVVFVE